MKCLHIYASSDGESHFGEVDISTELTPLFPNEAPLEFSAYYEASRVRFVHIPAGMREAGFHTPPGRLLAIWLDGVVEFETSGGEIKLQRKTARDRGGRLTAATPKVESGAPA